MDNQHKAENPGFLDFAKTFVGSWLTAMSGAISVPLTAAGVFSTSPLLKTGFIVTGVVCAVIASFRVWRNERIARSTAELALKSREAEFSALSIEFDNSNPRREYWSRESIKHPAKEGEWLVYKECRVGIRNNSNKTVRDVMVFSRPVGPIPGRPTPMLFDATKTTKCDINPGSYALVPVAQSSLEIFPGTACGPTAAEIYGPLEVVATGTDVASVTRIFQFDWQLEAMIYD